MTDPKFKPPRHIVVEGPIRVGKSTLAKVLAEQMHARRIFDCEDNPFLAEFYDEKPGAAFRAQMYFLYDRHRRLMEAHPEDVRGSVVSNFLFEKDKIFAYINLSDAELDLYNRYYQMFRAEVPTPELVIYLQASPEALKQRIRRKGVPGERAISDKYIEQVAAAYEHFFFHYSASDLLVVNTSDIDFVNNNRDLQLLLKRLAEPIHGTQYFLPLG